MRALRVGALAFLFGLIGWADAASAQEGAAALLPFQGPQAAKVRQKVQAGLRESEIRMIPLKKVTAVAKKTKGYAKQAARLNASVLVRARIRRAEGRFIADVGVRNAKGQRVDKFRTTSSSLNRLSNRIVVQLLKTDRMPEVAAAAAVAAAVPEAPAGDPEPPTKPRLVVRPFTGPQAAKVRSAAARGLRGEDVELYPNDRFVRKAESLGVDLGKDGGHVVPAGSLMVSGLIEGDVLREEGVWSAYVRLVDGASAKVISQHFYDASTSAALAKSVQTNLGDDLRKDLRKLGIVGPIAVGAAAAASTPSKRGKSAAKVDDTKKKKKRKKTDEKRPAAIDVGLDFRMVHRRFEYRDDLRGDLRDYRLKLGPGIGLKLQYFPGAHVTAGVGAQFGIDFEWERLFRIDSTRPDGASFPTESQQFLIGLRWRYPTGRWEPYVVLNYGSHNFKIGLSGPPVPGEDNTAGIPSVDYRFIRFGIGFRVQIGKKERFILATGIAFRGVFSLGDIESNVWFPQAKGNGMDANLMLGVALPKGFELRFGFDYRRYGLTLNPVPPPPEPPWVAGGALDQYIAGSVGFAWRW